MTGLQIKAAVELYIDDTLESTNVLTAINEAISIIGDMALVFDKVESDYKANMWYPLPAGCTYVDEVNICDGTNSVYTGYRIKGNEILFGSSNRYIINYRRQPRGIASLNDTPEIHEAYHQPIVTYVKGWVRLVDDEDSNDGLRLMAQWEKDIQRVYNMLKRKRSPKQVMVMRHA